MKVFVPGDPINVVTDFAGQYLDIQRKTAKGYGIYSRVYV
jgi:hypothetical protein